MTRTSSLLLILAVAATAGSCSKEGYDDEFGGVIDLSSGTGMFGSSTARTAGVPTALAPAKGFLSGAPAEFYDFGAVPVQTKPDPMSTATPPLTLPDYAFANPIYFFYDQDGNPMFSVPVRDERTGRWVMPGGSPTLGPNQVSGANRKIPFSLRERKQIVDSKRNTADHQRPIVDVVPIFGTTSYTGYWELIEVRMSAGYTPDSIKSLDTLERAVSDGQATWKSTGIVLNCPLVDERTLVTPSLANWSEPAPRIEVWYRRKMGYCLLANGYRSLAKDGQLLSAGSPDRVQTMKQGRVEITGGSEKQVRLVVPADQLLTPFIPGKTAFDPAVAQPPITSAQPTTEKGADVNYTPLRYPWNVNVPVTMPATPVPTDEATVDPTWIVRPATVAAKNFALLGPLPNCGVKTTAADMTVSCGDAPPACPEGLVCNMATCNCDLPAVGYGELCAPGVARCKLPAELSDEEKAFAPKGFVCHPTGRGFCLPKCDSTVNGGADDCPVDTFACVTPRANATTATDAEKKASVCMRTCDLTKSASISTKACQMKSGTSYTDKGGKSLDLADRLVCQTQRNITACNFDDALEPH